MAVLIACEESQVVTTEFRKLGIEAYSCDILPTSGNHPEWHLQQDVIPLLNEKWDMIIAFPPCTHLASSGARYWKEKQADGRQQKAINFFMAFTQVDCPIAVENPVGILSSVYRKPDQYIEPYQFGEPYTKKTCLWLQDLPLLQSTNVIEPIYYWVNSSCRGNRLSRNKSTSDPKVRSKTFNGIARAMAEQWSKYL